MTPSLREAIERVGRTLLYAKVDSVMVPISDAHVRAIRMDDLRLILSALEPDEEKVARAIYEACPPCRDPAPFEELFPNAKAKFLAQARAAIQSLVGGEG